MFSCLHVKDWKTGSNDWRIQTPVQLDLRKLREIVDESAQLWLSFQDGDHGKIPILALLFTANGANDACFHVSIDGFICLDHCRPDLSSE